MTPQNLGKNESVNYGPFVSEGLYVVRQPIKNTEILVKKIRNLGITRDFSKVV